MELVIFASSMLEHVRNFDSKENTMICVHLQGATIVDQIVTIVPAEKYVPQPVDQVNYI